MASTYVNDLRLNEMATGDGSGTWGTTTNTNLELIAEAFSYGTEVITTNADTHTTTIADGATDPGRSLYLKYTGTLDSACTITIGPNTVSKVWIIENGTSGSQDIILSQGSGANITIPAGDTKVVYSDGAGAGAAFFDAFASLSVVDLKVQDDLTVTGDIDVDGTTNLDVVDIDGAVDMASTLGVTGVATLASLVATTADINGGTVDGTVIGGTTAAAISGTTGQFGTSLNVDGTATMDGLTVEGASSVAQAQNTTLGTNVGLVVGTIDAAAGVGDLNQIGFHYNPSGSIPASIISSILTSTEGYTKSDLIFSTRAVTTNTAPTERMRIISSGFVGIGETDPEAKLHLYTVGLEDGILVEGNDNNNVKIRLKNIGTGGEEWQAQVGLQGASNEGFHIRSNTASANRLSIDSSGNVNITSNWLQLFGNNTLFSSTGAGGLIIQSPSGADTTIFRTSATTERFRIASNARLAINGSATANAHGNFVGEVGAAFRALSFENTVGGGECGTVTTTASTTSYNTTSDYRLKENVVPMTGSIDRVKALKPSRFNFIVDADKTVDGFLAHEAQEVVPECVTGTKDAMRDEEYEVTAAVLDDDGNVVTEAVMGTRSVPEMQGIDQSKLVPLLTAALQEAITKIEDLTTRLETLENA
jgi:hypothetical protein